MGWGMDLGAWLWMGIWVVALLAMVWLAVRGSDRHPAGEDALAILRARYARGEISQQEFERAREVLAAEQRAPGRESA